MNQTQPVSAQLKEQTREHHVRAERHPLQQAVVSGRIDRRQWGLLTAQNRVLQEAMESAIDSAAAREARLARVFAPHHRRLAKFDADLAALGTPEADRAPLEATAKVCAWIKDLARTRPLSLLGVLYVIEGATNGGQFIARAVRPALRLGEGPGCSALDPHGPETGRLWGGFRSAIDALELPQEDRDAIVASAGETFDALGRVFSGVAERAGVAPGAGAGERPSAAGAHG